MFRKSCLAIIFSIFCCMSMQAMEIEKKVREWVCYKGELSVLNVTDNRGIVISEIRVRWRINALLHEPVKCIIIKWVPGDSCTHLNGVYFRAQVKPGVYFAFGAPFIPSPGKWGFDVGASPSWAGLFQDKDGNNKFHKLKLLYLIE